MSGCAGGAGRGRAVVAVMLTAVLAAGGCSQPGRSSRSAHSGDRSSLPAGSSSAGRTVLDGTELAGLLTGVALPAGWIKAPDLGVGVNETDSGPVILPEPAGPPAGGGNCTLLDPGASALEFINWWDVSDAALNVEDAVDGQEATLMVGGFQPANDAGQVMPALASLAGRCRSFRDREGGRESVTTGSIAQAAQIGSQNLYLVARAHTPSGPVVTQVLFARVGSYLIGVDTADNVSRAAVKQLGFALASAVPSG